MISCLAQQLLISNLSTVKCLYCLFCLLQDELDNREREIQTFEDALNLAREEAQRKGIIAARKNI